MSIQMSEKWLFPFFHNHSFNMKQSTVSTEKDSIIVLIFASTIDTLHNTINGYDIACTWHSKYNVHVHVCMIQTNADFIF